MNARGTFVLIYKAKDDYGIASAEGLVEKGDGFKGRRSLVPAPQIALAIPGADEDGETRSIVDLSNHPWAGARVKLTLLAKDEAGQEGRIEHDRFHPAAAALHEAPRQGPRRAAAQARARPGRPPARAGRRSTRS